MGSHGFFIGGIREDQNFNWVDGSTFNSTTIWAKDEPDNTGNCMIMNKEGLFQDSNCLGGDNKFYYLCAHNINSNAGKQTHFDLSACVLCSFS